MLVVVNNEITNLCLLKKNLYKFNNIYFNNLKALKYVKDTLNQFVISIFYELLKIYSTVNKFESI